MRPTRSFLFFFFNDTAPTEIYTLSLHDALPIWQGSGARASRGDARPSGYAPAWADHRSLCPPAERRPTPTGHHRPGARSPSRSEEHTSELQSQSNLVCRLLLEKKKKVVSDTIY